MTSPADQEIIDRFRRFLEIVGQAPRDEEGHYLVGPRTIRYARGEDVHPEGCTGLTARWCPVHGLCTCPQDGPLSLNEDGCPLHDIASSHPELDDLDRELLEAH